MSFNLNHVTVSGNLTRDAELKAVGQNQVLNFSVAVSDDYYNKQTQQTTEQSYFFDCTIWGKRAESLEKFLKKGSKVAVEGKLAQERWKDQQGNNRSKVKIIASNVVLMGSKPNNSQNSNGNYNNNSQPNNVGQQQAANFQPGSQQVETNQFITPTMQATFDSHLNNSDMPF